MKKLLTNYTFDPTTGQVALLDYTAVDQESILLITNVTRGTILYNFADASRGGSVAGNVVTLTLDLTGLGMSGNDSLQIYYDDPAETPASNESVALLHEQNLLMRRLLKTTESLATVDLAQRQRVVIDGGPGVLFNNPMFFRQLDANNVNAIAPNGAAFTSMYAVQDVWRTIDNARLNFQQGIRANLSFS